MPKLLRRIVLALVLLMIAAAVAWAFLPKPAQVDVARIDYGPLRVTVDEDGKTRIRERYIVSAPLGGRLQRITLKAGDAVTAEETVLAVIEPTDPALLDARAHAEARARVEAAQAAVDRAEALLVRAQQTLDYNRRERERLEAALQRDAAKQREVDEKVFAERVAEQDLRSAEFQRDIARFELAQARAALLRTRGDSPTEPGSVPTTAPGSPAASPAPPPGDPPQNGAEMGSDAAGLHFVIRSPIGGQVLRVMQESTAVVMPGTPLIEVGDPRDLEVVVDVLSRDGARIEPGAMVYLSGWGGERELTGAVRRVEPSGFTKISALGVEEQRVNVIVDLTTPTQQRQTLGDWFRVDAHIVLWEQGHVLKAPMSALFRDGERWQAYVMEDGRAAKRTVQVGRQNGLEAEILDGLRPGETVIIHPPDTVHDAARVQPRS